MVALVRKKICASCENLICSSAKNAKKDEIRSGGFETRLLGLTGR
jgi:hypothetical protein